MHADCDQKLMAGTCDRQNSVHGRNEENIDINLYFNDFKTAKNEWSFPHKAHRKSYSIIQREHFDFPRQGQLAILIPLPLHFPLCFNVIFSSSSNSQSANRKLHRLG